MRCREQRLADKSTEHKRELLKRLLEERAAEVESSHPLSYGQRALWYLHRLAPASAAYNIVFAGHLRSPVDVPALRRASLAVIDRHPALRTVYSTKDREPVQRVEKRRDVYLDVMTCPSWSWAELQGRMLEEADRPFDLESGPLLRMTLFIRSPDDAVLLLAVHHIAVDLWSLELLVTELADLYRAERTGLEPELAEIRVRYTDYVRWQANMLAGPEGERLWAYWKRQVAGELPTLRMPMDRPRPALKTYGGALHEFQVTGKVLESLVALSRAEGATLYMVFLAAFQVFLHRYSGQDDVLVGSPTAGRRGPEHEQLVGYFSNPVVLRSTLSGSPRFRNFLHQVRTNVLGAVEHQDYPFNLMVERLNPPRDPSRSPIFDASFAWDMLRRPARGKPTVSASGANPATIVGADDLEIEPLFSQQRGAPFDLTLSMSEGKEAVAGTLQYNTDLFDAPRIARMARHFENLLEAVASNPDQRVRCLGLLKEDERAQILMAWNDTKATYPRKAIVPELFEAQVDRTPRALAVREDERQLTYSELNCRANRLAHRLRTLGVRPEVRVGMVLGRSVNMVSSMLGILKAGGAYVPVDSRYPRERIAMILKDAEVSVLVTDARSAESLAYLGFATVVCGDGEQRELAGASVGNVASGATPENLAYVIYTSGSTGRPKGVMIPHRALVNYSCWSARAYSLEQGHGSPVHTSVGFDLTITSLIPPLLTGKLVVLLPEGREMEALSLALGNRSDFSLVKLTPAHLEVLARRSCASSLRGGTRALVVGGEQFPAHALSFWQKHAPATRILNEYGPTETTVGCCVHEVLAGTRMSGSVPIGRPIANARLYVLDAELEPVPIGVVGELCIGGDGLARGYLHRPEVTADRFVPDPFSGVPGSRLYRTGDLGRHLETGDIEFVGRLDRQIKIRGFRIEPGEIEFLLDQHAAVHESVVLAREERPGERRLVAYWVPAGNGEASAGELRRFLKERLPESMVPSAFVRMDRFPQTPNGKLDRAALPAPDPSTQVNPGGFAAPRTPAEDTLAQIWAHVLGAERVGIDDNFFELGGTSLHSVEVARQVEDAGIPLQPELLLKYQTIAELVAAPEMISAVRPRSRTVIESLGVYLPPKRVSTEEVVRSCEKPLTVPLERMTGIAFRHVVGEREFSMDLAERAISDCLSASEYEPEDIDLLICCNISRYDGPGFRVSFEPCTSVRLRNRFGFDKAVVLDIGNACAGMFTAIYVVDALIKARAVRRAMVVSGEYISHLTKTAQREIQGDLDPRLACLTLGDCGAAVILEESSGGTAGFHEIDLYTLGRYSSYCVAKATDREHGGAIMLTDAIRSAALTIPEAVKNAAQVLGRAGWSLEDVQHVVMHQTSQTSLRGAVREINRRFSGPACHDGKVVDNLTRRGNTATTTHMVAVHDAILGNRITSGDRVVFGISGSGQTIGTALYTFDDLPERVRQHRANGRRVSRERGRNGFTGCAPKVYGAAVRVESVGTVPPGTVIRRDAVEMAKIAARNCFAQSAYGPSDIDVLIYAGVYRNDFLSEPAMAALLAGEQRMNDDIESPYGGRKTLAFDIFNGSVGFLKACYVATHLIEAGRASTVMVVASEFENNRDVRPKELLGIEETGSAMILDRSGQQDTGFGQCVFRYETRLVDAFATYTGQRDGKTFLRIMRDPELEVYFLTCIRNAVVELLDLERVNISEVRTILPPQISSDFAAQLAGQLGVNTDSVVDVTRGGKGYSSSSLPYGWLRACREQAMRAGDRWLLISAGSGVEVGCALYRF